LEHARAISYRIQQDLFNNVWLAPIGAHLTPFLKGFMVGSQIPNLTFGLSFDHKLCISSLNEQCEDTLSSYILKPFQWYLGRPTWWFFHFQLKL
jgi:hypothetical protein